MRAAVAKVMARPSLNQLAPTRTDNTLDRTFAVFYDGNAELEPVEADQADLSVEWYFDDKSVLSGAVFWKDISGFITYELQENVDIGVIADIGGAGPAPLLYDVSRPINGDKAKVLGLEFGAQHFFDNGFGVRANYSWIDTKAYIDGVNVGQLEGVSKSSYSARADVRERPLGCAGRRGLQRQVHGGDRCGRRACRRRPIRSPG